MILNFVKQLKKSKSSYFKLFKIRFTWKNQGGPPYAINSIKFCNNMYNLKLKVIYF